uniref:Vitelline envelope zona pellucida domain 7 n=1 Tax=Haliotis rufescens TaxID=6454 RepID=A0MCQ0_HALRU|nr:vitelline envelope zona pellucida domain 7 [Haliotis rufescens]
MSLFPLLLVSACVMSAWAVIPHGYILSVTSNCGKENAKGAEIAIVTDLDIAARADCATSSENFTSTDEVNFKLSVGYPGFGSHACQLQKRKGARVYVLKMFVSYGSPGAALHHSQEEYTITCTFDAKNTQLTKQLKIGASRVAPKEVKSWSGKKTNAVIRLLLVDVLGRDVHGQRLATGRKVQLKAFATGTAPNERGLRPVSCDAIGVTTGARFALLRSGCGDGWFIKRNQGFTTRGLSCASPFFSAFSLPNKEPMGFQCNFTVCERNCDGDSCAVDKARRRKSASSDESFIPASSGFISPDKIDHRKSVELVSRRTSDEHLWVSRVFIWAPVVIIMAIGVLVSIGAATRACARRNLARKYEVAPKVSVLSLRPCGCSRDGEGGCMSSWAAQNDLNRLAHLETERPYKIRSSSGVCEIPCNSSHGEV